MTTEEKAFYQGAAVILGTLARTHDMPSLAVDIMKSNGITIGQLKDAEASGFDLAAIYKEMRNER